MNRSHNSPSESGLGDQFPRQPRPQLLPRIEQPAHHSADGDIHHLGDLPITQLRLGMQYESLPLSLRKSQERLIEHLSQLRPVHLESCLIGDQKNGEVSLANLGGLQAQALASSALPTEIERSVADNSQQPRLE